jgi:hypothetical protein
MLSVVLPISFAASTARADAPADLAEVSLTAENGASRERPTSAIAISMGPSISWPRASRLTFGPLTAEGARKSGRELALGTPTLAGGELSVFYVRRYVSLGLIGGFEGNVASDNAASASEPPYAQTSSLVNRSVGSLVRYDGAVELDGSLPFGRARVSAGARVGVVTYSIATTTLTTTCSSLRNGDHPCTASAWSPVYAVLEPRVRVSIPIVEAAIWLDGSAGYDLVTGGPSAGLSLRLQFPLGANANYRFPP